MMMMMSLVRAALGRARGVAGRGGDATRSRTRRAVRRAGERGARAGAGADVGRSGARETESDENERAR